MSRLAVLNNKFEDTDTLIKNVKKMLIRSMKVVLSTFEDIDNIVFVADGGSWRNNVPIPNSLIKKSKNGEIVSEEYKGTREKSKDIDWDAIFKGYEEFIDKLSETGITTCREKNIEGDDWVYFWSNYFNSIGTNVIIWSADKDLTQLVKTDKHYCFTIWYNGKNEITEEEVEQDDMDFFFNTQYYRNEAILINISDAVKYKNYINPKHVVIDKILKGDSSDNIQPIMIRKSKTGKSSKKFKISTNDIYYDLNYNNDVEVLNYLSKIYNSKSYIDRVEDSIDDVFEHYKYNRKLVELSNTEIPDEVINKMKEYINRLTYSCDLSKAESHILAESNDISAIAELI